MAVYKNKGIVLRSIRYGEADRILDLYTRDAGLVSAIAKGIRRTKSRFGARLEPLSCVDFVASGGRSRAPLTPAAGPAPVRLQGPPAHETPLRCPPGAPLLRRLRSLRRTLPRHDHAGGDAP